MKHTPGPWFVGQPNHKKQRIDISTKTHDSRCGYTAWEGFARCYGIEDEPKLGSEIMLANVRLIAAAPELLEALQEALNLLDEICPVYGDTQRKAKSIIAKATGIGNGN